MKKFKQSMITILCLIFIQLCTEISFAGDGGSSGNSRTGVVVSAIPNSTLNYKNLLLTSKSCLNRHILKPLFESQFHCVNITLVNPDSNFDNTVKAHCDSNESKQIILNNTGLIFGMSEIYNGKKTEQTPEETLSLRPDSKVTNIQIWDGPKSSNFVDEDGEGLPLIMFEFVYHLIYINQGTAPDGTFAGFLAPDIHHNGEIINLHINPMGDLNEKKEFKSDDESCEGPKCSISLNTKGYVECLQSEFAKSQ